MPVSHIIGFDDLRFSRSHRGGVPIAAIVFRGLRLEGVVRPSRSLGPQCIKPTPISPNGQPSEPAHDPDHIL